MADDYGPHFYRLDDEGEPERVADTITWAQWMESHERIVLQTHVGAHCRVSTIFLGLDHNHFSNDDPILWETMIFGGALDMSQWRYRAKLAALQGHLRAVVYAELAAWGPRKLKKVIRTQRNPRNGRAREYRRIGRALGRAVRFGVAAQDWSEQR
jgi:hypothetical protein